MNSIYGFASIASFILTLILTGIVVWLWIQQNNQTVVVGEQSQLITSIQSHFGTNQFTIGSCTLRASSAIETQSTDSAVTLPPDTFSLRCIGDTADVVLSKGDQQLDGSMTFAKPVQLLANENQIVFGSDDRPSVTIDVSIPDGTSIVDPITYHLPCIAETEATLLLSKGDSRVEGNWSFAESIQSDQGVVLGNSNNQLTVMPGSSTYPREYIVPDAGNESNFVMTTTNQFMSGKTFTSTVYLFSGSQQLSMSTGKNEVKLSSGTSIVPREYTLPDVGPVASFVMTQGNQSMAGIKTFSDGIAFGSSPSSSILSSYQKQTIACTLTGPWAQPLSTTLFILRIGDHVILQLNPIEGSITHSDIIQSQPNAIPLQLLPSSIQNYPIHQTIIVQNNGVPVQGTWKLLSGNDAGTFVIAVGQSSVFTAGQCGVYVSKLDYLV